jgi:hypothetical protein
VLERKSAKIKFFFSTSKRILRLIATSKPISNEPNAKIFALALMAAQVQKDVAATDGIASCKTQRTKKRSVMSPGR